MTEPPKLYPSHQHQWVQSDFPDADDGPPHMAHCTVCGFEVPWRLANLDGETAPCEHCGNPHHTRRTCPQRQTQPDQESA